MSLITTPSLFAESRGAQSCYCKIGYNSLSIEEEVRPNHFNSLSQCYDHLTKKKTWDTWSDVCTDKNQVSFELSCGGEKKAYKTRCQKRTEFHSYLFFTNDAKIQGGQGALNFHDGSEFNLRRSFSDLALYIEKNPNLSITNSLAGGIYDSVTSRRIDLTIIDFYHQIRELAKSMNNQKFLAAVDQAVGNDPIKNFPRLFRLLDSIKTTKIKRKMSNLVPIVYDRNGFAEKEHLSYISKVRFLNPNYTKKVNLYNKFAASHNREALFKETKKKFFKNLNTPVTAHKLFELDEKSLDSLFNSVNYDEHIKRVTRYSNEDRDYQLVFGMNKETGVTYLAKVNPRKSGVPEISESAIEVFNYIHSKMLLTIEVPGVTPSLIQKNLERWEDLIQEYSWSRQISIGDDQVLLVLRDWMKKNYSAVQSKLRPLVEEADVKKELMSWKQGRRPKRGLTLDVYEFLKEEFKDRPWEKHFVINEKGQKIVIGENQTDRTVRNVWSILRNFFSTENVASAAVSTAVMSTTTNPYLSASASTIVHDTIVAYKYGYEIDEYLKRNSPANLATSMIFASGFLPGRFADAVFTGAATGGIQSILTGRDIRLGMLVGGISGGVLQTLPPELSQWVVTGEDKDGLNIFTELAEEAVFKGMNGAVVAYMEDGDWVSGAKEGALFGLGYAGMNMLLYGVRYDANAYISDEEIAEYNELHNHAEGDYHGTTLSRETSDMASRYGKEIKLTREDIERANIRKGGLIQNGKGDDVYGTNFTNVYDSQISINTSQLTREETILHEVMHTRQAQQGRMLRVIHRLPEGFWEEYEHIGDVALPKGYYKTFIYVDLTDDLKKAL
jgi:hypothetical protein